MAIGSNDGILKFNGSWTDLTVATPAAIAAGAFSVASENSAWTDSDDAGFANFVLVVLATGLSGAPTAGETVGLYAQPLNMLDSTPDAPVPGVGSYESTEIGTFELYGSDTDQYLPLSMVQLPAMEASQEYEFFIRLNTNTVTLASVSDAWSLHVQAVTRGPHA